MGFKYFMKTTLLVAFLFSTSSTFASVEWANHLNKNKHEVVDLITDMKYFFPSDEDNRLIDQDAKVLEKSASKWVWRFEWHNDQMALRVNGKVQAKFKVIKAVERKFFRAAGKRTPLGEVSLDWAYSHLMYKSGFCPFLLFKRTS